MTKRKITTRLTQSQRRTRYAIRKVAIVSGIIVAAILLITTDRFGVFGVKASPDPEKYHDKTFVVVRIVDGDTIDVDIPDGKYPHTRIRLWGVDTPETKKPHTPIQHFGPEATRFTRKLCMGKKVRLELEPDKKPRGKHGRLLAWVYLPDGRMLNRLLVEQGYAYADPRFDHHLKKEFRGLQNEAQHTKRGLWKNVRRQDLPYYYREGRHRIKLR